MGSCFTKDVIKEQKIKCSGEVIFQETDTEVIVKYVSYIDFNYGKMIYCEPFCSKAMKTDNEEIIKLCKKVRDLPIATFGRIEVMEQLYKCMKPVYIHTGIYFCTDTITTSYCVSSLTITSSKDINLHIHPYI